MLLEKKIKRVHLSIYVLSLSIASKLNKWGWISHQ